MAIGGVVYGHWLLISVTYRNGQLPGADALDYIRWGTMGHLGVPGHAGLLPRLPTVRLDIVVLDDDAEAIAEAIAKQARTETIGDGKIWITPVDGVLRVRTGERDRAAV